MLLKSFLKKFFLGGEVLEKVCSPVNGDISVVEDLFGRRELRIGGITQSGELVERLWKVALSNVQSSKFKVQSCLILGLGGGDIVRLINKIWPEAKIIGVEIDPIVVKLGKKYFKLNRLGNLKIILGDAVKMVISDEKYLIGKKFDLVIVDLYLGTDYPKKAGNKEFLHGLKNILSKDGLVIVNRLYYTSSFKKETEKFLAKVEHCFSKVRLQKTLTNLLIFASN